MEARNYLSKEHPYHNSRTSSQWKKLKRVVNDDAVGLRMWANKSYQGCYTYYTEEETRPATEEELKAWREAKREAARKRRAEIKAKAEREKLAEENRRKREQERTRRLREVVKENIICLDVETTGLYPGSDEILQVSIINGNGEVLLNEYVRPKYNTEWEEAYEVHGISPEMVADKEHIEELLPTLNQIMEKAELIVGYNTEFDLAFLSFSGVVIPESVMHYDVMYEFAPIYGVWSSYYKSYKWQSLETCADYFGYKGTGSFHDSLEDIKATLYCFYKIIGI